MAISKKSLLVLVLAFQSLAVHAEGNLILRVRAISVKVTDFCSNCTPTNAHESYWTVYRAKVTDTLQGEPGKKRVTFAYAQHAQYIKSVLKDFVVVLQPAPEWLREKTNADYVVAALDFPKTGVCFDPEYIEASDDDSISNWVSNNGCLFENRIE